MLLGPEHFFGWDAFTYVLMAAVAILVFVLAYRSKKSKWGNLCALIVLVVLIVLSEVALSFQLGGTNLFFLEWMAYFGELLLFLPGFVGCLAGVLAKFVITKKHN